MKSVWPTDSTALPTQPIQPANDTAVCCMQAAVQEALPLIHPPRPRVRRFVSPALLQSLCHWAALAAESGTYRVGLACLAADQAGQELLHTEFLSLRDAHDCHRCGRVTTIPPCRSCVKAKLVARLHCREKKQRPKNPGASAVEQARYSSELRTDGAGSSVTPSGSHRSSRAGRDRTVRIQLSPHGKAPNQCFQWAGILFYERFYCERKLGNQRFWIPMKLKAAEYVECRFLMNRSLEAYLLADKANRAMLAAAIYVFLRTAAYRRVLMRMRGICSICRSILFRTRNLPTTEHTFSESAVRGVQSRGSYCIGRAYFTTNEA